MAKNDNLTDFLTDVANTIRRKKGIAGKINPQNFSAEIQSIQTGGGSGEAIPTASLNDVTFYDYNGHILYSYSYTDFLALNAMPELPSREGLVCTGWTHTLEEAKEYVSGFRRLNIGACYTTSNGRTRLHFDVYSDENLQRKFTHSIDIPQGVTVYYGDGKISQNSGTGSRVWTKTYPSKGSYIFEIEAADGAVFGLGSNGTAAYRPFFGSDYFDTQNSYPYGAGLNKMYCGNNISYYYNYFSARHKTLQEITLTPPASIGNYAFEETSIGCVVIPYGITSIGQSAFLRCPRLTAAILPNTITELGSHAFYNCSLRTIDLPTGLQSIPEYAFSLNSFLEVVTVPKSVVSISGAAFKSCYGLRILNLCQHEVVPTITGSDVFTSTNYLKIVVPDSLYDEWIAAPYWTYEASKIIKKSEWEAQLTLN